MMHVDGPATSLTSPCPTQTTPADGIYYGTIDRWARDRSGNFDYACMVSPMAELVTILEAMHRAPLQTVRVVAVREALAGAG